MTNSSATERAKARSRMACQPSLRPRTVSRISKVPQPQTMISGINTKSTLKRVVPLRTSETTGARKRSVAIGQALRPLWAGVRFMCVVTRKARINYQPSGFLVSTGSRCYREIFAKGWRVAPVLLYLGPTITCERFCTAL